MRLGISSFKAGTKTIKFKTPLLLNPVEGLMVEGGICINNDELCLNACAKTLLECDVIIREELESLWADYALVPHKDLTVTGIGIKENLLSMVDSISEPLDIKNIKYPSLNSIMTTHPDPLILLGHTIFWEEKRDGSNIGIYLNEEDKLCLRSRNLDVASGDIHRIFLETDEAEKAKELLISMQDMWNDGCVIFGELLTKGKSPSRTELHEKHGFVVFDIWSSKVGGLIPYISVQQHCHDFDIPIVELYGYSQHITLESLLEFRDEMLEIAKKNGREGIVGKTFEGGKKYLYFKEKLEIPRHKKKPNCIEDGKPMLPLLSESEILGALDKALVDLGTTDFKDVKKAMPLFAKYVRVECKKHNCTGPEGNLFSYYKAKIQGVG